MYAGRDTRIFFTGFGIGVVLTVTVYMLVARDVRFSDLTVSRNGAGEVNLSVKSTGRTKAHGLRFYIGLKKRDGSDLVFYDQHGSAARGDVWNYSVAKPNGNGPRHDIDFRNISVCMFHRGEYFLDWEWTVYLSNGRSADYEPTREGRTFLLKPNCPRLMQATMEREARRSRDTSDRANYARGTQASFYRR